MGKEPYENEDWLLTTEEVAYMLSLSPGTIHNWRYRGVNLPFIKMGRVIRYRKEDVEEFIEDKKIKKKLEK